MVLKVDRKNCFAYASHGFCNALEVMECKDCKFFKTKEQLEFEEKKVRGRISTLPLQIQDHIRKKYSELKFD